MVAKHRLLLGKTTTFSGINLDSMGMREGHIITTLDRCPNEDDASQIDFDARGIEQVIKTSSCSVIAYTKLPNDKLVEILMDYAIHDSDGDYVLELGNHQLKGGRKIKITVMVDDV